MIRTFPTSPVLGLAIVLTLLVPTFAGGLEFSVSFGEEQSAEPLDGRLPLLIGVDGESEPRFQVRGSLTSAQVFGVDVDGMKAGGEVVIGTGVFGYPLRDLADLKPGTYFVQALLHEYETFHVAHGHTLKLPMDRGEGQHWNRAPGNLYSEPKEMRLDPGDDRRIEIVLD